MLSPRAGRLETPGGRVQGIAAGSGGFEVDCSFVAVRLNQFRRDCVQASKFRENHPACWGQRMRFNLFPDVIFQVHDSAPRAEYASAAATCQGQDAGLAVCVVWNLDGRFADSLLIQDLIPRLDAGFQEIQLCGCEFEVVSGRLVDVPGVDDQVEAVEAQ